MSIENVRLFFKQYGKENDIMEFDTSSATVELAAAALNVIPAKITKTLALKCNDGCMIIAVAGDTKIDNQKFKKEFGFKAKMLTPEETLSMTSHAVGGVCPFALPQGVKTYVDVSLKRFDKVFPACGSSNSAIGLNCEELYQYAGAEKWVDICKGWE